MTRSRIGLALGSGSARGWSHVGVIDALIEAGIEPSVVCRTSTGSFIGATHVAGRLNELRQWAEAATWRDVAGLLDLRLIGGGLIGGKLIVAGAIERYPKRYAADLAASDQVRCDASNRRCPPSDGLSAKPGFVHGPPHLLLAHRVISQQRSISVAFRAKRTSTDRQDRRIGRKRPISAFRCGGDVRRPCYQTGVNRLLPARR